MAARREGEGLRRGLVDALTRDVQRRVVLCMMLATQQPLRSPAYAGARALRKSRSCVMMVIILSCILIYEYEPQLHNKTTNK